MDDHLARALEALAEGDLEIARAAAGEAVRADRARPDGFLLLGEIHLEDGELRDAREAFERAVEKALAAGALEFVAEARWGLARAAILGERLPEAAAALSTLLEDPDAATIGAAVLLAELRLRMDDPAGALSAVPKDDDLPPDGWLVRAFAAFGAKEGSEAVACARRAFLGNLFYAALLLGDEPEDLGFDPGYDEATRDAAEEARLRLSPLFEQHPEYEDLLAAVAAHPEVQREREALLAAARALARLGPGRERDLRSAAIAELRNPGRLRSSSVSILEDLCRDEDPKDGEFPV